jgi:hypothetical protein
MNIKYSILKIKYLIWLVIPALKIHQQFVKTDKIPLLETQYLTKHLSDSVGHDYQIVSPYLISKILHHFRR